MQDSAAGNLLMGMRSLVSARIYAANFAGLYPAAFRQGLASQMLPSESLFSLAEADKRHPPGAARRAAGLPCCTTAALHVQTGA